VGSRVPGRADILQAEYMSGHMISVHTWSHPSLTMLTNAEIVAELGWTRQIIKDAIGVTPNTMRPPYGDIDDRVRAIALAMGLRPIIWTSYENNNFDSNDWKIYGGTATGNSSLESFETILAEAQDLDTGFIVLEHDLYEATVDLAVGYILPMAIEHEPPFTLTSIVDCYHLPASEAYMETASTSPFRATDAGLLTAANNTHPSVSVTNGGVVTITTTVGGQAVVTSAVAGSTPNGASRSFGQASGSPWVTWVGVLAAVGLGAVFL